MRTWTQPYHGVQHLNNLPSSHQVTVCDYGTMATAFVLALRSNRPFAAIAETTCATASEARQWAERQAVAIDIGQWAR